MLPRLGAGVASCDRCVAPIACVPAVSDPAFVSFHADRPAGIAGAHPNANLDTAGYRRMLDLLFRSVRLTHPQAACVLLTDSSTRMQGIRGGVQRIEGPVDHAALMLSRSRAQAEFVARSDFRRPLVLLDSDILLNGSLRPLFDEDFDVGVTWRPIKNMPLNGGLLVLHNRRPEVAKAFFARFLRTYVERFAGDGNGAWYGDQLALQECVGLSRQQLAQQTQVEKDGCRIRLLPCDTYNFSPENRLDAIADGLPDKLVLHFKGQRKRLMQPFWETFLAPRQHGWWFPNHRARKARERLQSLIAAEPPVPPPAAAGQSA